MTIQQSRLRHQRQTNKMCKDFKKKGIKSLSCETWENTNGFKGDNLTPKQRKFFDSINKPSWEITYQIVCSTYENPTECNRKRKFGSNDEHAFNKRVKSMVFEELKKTGPKPSLEQINKIKKILL